jgi:hypothetical protein
VGSALDSLIVNPNLPNEPCSRGVKPISDYKAGCMRMDMLSSMDCLELPPPLDEKDALNSELRDCKIAGPSLPLTIPQMHTIATARTITRSPWAPPFCPAFVNAWAAHIPSTIGRRFMTCFIKRNATDKGNAVNQ